MPIKLYPYQQEIKNEVYRLAKEGYKRILTVAMTGSGKSIILASIVADAVSKGKICLILVTRSLLVGQLSKSLSMFDIEHSFIKAGKPFELGKTCYIGTLQSISARGLPISFDVLVVDEAHETTFHKAFEKLISQCLDPWVFGFTASPWRLSSKESLAEKYEKAVYAPVTSKLIEMGFLVPGIYYGFPSKPSVSGLKLVRGDYRESDLEIACNTPELVAHVVEQFRSICPSRKAICFTVNIAHGKAIEREFIENGFACRHVDGSMPEKEREQIYAQLEKGEIQILVSCNVTTTGFDVKSIDCVILCRPTASKSLHFQQVGRAMRIAPGTNKKDFICLDQAGNILKFGPPESLTLAHLAMDSPGSQTAGDPPMKECPHCHYMSLISKPICEKCGYIFPVAQSNKLKLTEDFVRIDEKDQQRKLRKFQLMARACFRDRKNWSIALASFRNKFGEWPSPEICYQAVFQGINTEANQIKFAEYLIEWASKKGKKPSAVLNILKNEFDKALLPSVITLVEKRFSIQKD